MKSLLASFAAVLLLGLSLPPAFAEESQVGEAFRPGRVVAHEGVNYPRVKRQIFVPRADGKRDELQHLLYLAESANTTRKRARGYRDLAEILLQVGRGQEAMRAYEAAALQGDGPSATIVMRSHAEGRYEPVWLAELLTLVYVPRARLDGTGGPLLMAELIDSGRVTGVGTRGEWLQLAASRGSTQAGIELAEAAEFSGKIATASKLYARVDKISKLDRALRQARVSFLGEERKKSTKLALAWLDYASSLDSAAAARQAASLWKKHSGSDEAQAQLLEVALAGGIDPQGSGGAFGRLRDARTAEERTAILAELKTAADAGNGNAALAIAQDRLGSGDTSLEDEGYTYLAQALAAGLEPAMSDAAGRLVALPEGSPRVAPLLEAMTKAADGGMVSAMWALADLYAYGGPIAADPQRSMSYLRAAADAGHLEAQLRLGLQFAQQKADPEQVKLARHYLEAAANQGSAPAKTYLAAL